MAEAPDRQALLTALTTEHFTLQSARSQTASESASRAVGGVAAFISPVALLRYADRLLEERAGRTESIFPSPQR